MRQLFSSTFARFLYVGGTAALINILTRPIFNLGTSYEVAIVLAFAVALTFAFLMNRLFVFTPRSGTVTGQYIRFTLVNVLGLAQVWIISVGLARALFPYVGFTWHAETVSHVIGVLSPAVTSYFAHKHFTFYHADTSSLSDSDNKAPPR